MPKPIKQRKSSLNKKGIREITKTSSPTENKYLAERKKAEQRNQALKQISTKTGIGEKAVERKINRAAAKKSLIVKENILEISKERYTKIKENIRRINSDKTIDPKQKDLFLKILEKQLESVRKTYLAEMEKKK